MARLGSILFLLATISLSATLAAPVADIQSRQESATVNFTPYASHCQMSPNPHDPNDPAHYENITTASGCITPPYAFTSYVEGANDEAANGPCSLSIFSGPNCTGSVSAGFLTTSFRCYFADGQSVELVCGP